MRSWKEPSLPTVTRVISSSSRSSADWPSRTAISCPGSKPMPCNCTSCPGAPLAGMMARKFTSASPSKGTVATPRTSPSSVANSSVNSGPLSGVPSSHSAGTWASMVTLPESSVCPWPNGSVVKLSVMRCTVNSTTTPAGKPWPVTVMGVLGPMVGGSMVSVGVPALSMGAGGVVWTVVSSQAASATTSNRPSKSSRRFM